MRGAGSSHLSFCDLGGPGTPAAHTALGREAQRTSQGGLCADHTRRPSPGSGPSSRTRTGRPVHGTLTVLRHPYPRCVEEPSIYESVRVHAAMQTNRTERDLVPSAPALGTKEGFLTKQGGLVKTWKTRWFTLHRNELKYFKDQMSPEPIRILDLTECSAVQFDYSQERVNCFCLVFPFRTFYLCAKTGVEADEWIRILRWKLAQIRKQLGPGEATVRSQSFIFK